MVQVKYNINLRLNGVEICFTTKPASYLLCELKQTGWRWHSQKRCWYTYNSKEHVKQARRICQLCNKDVTNCVKKHKANEIINWNEESVLRRNGYTVSQMDGLLSIERQGILKRIIDKKILSPEQIIYHIETQIALREKNERYEEACQKWKEDIFFLKRNYAC